MTTTDMQAKLQRIASELRAYNPAADEYKGEHIHKVWAREIDATLACRPDAQADERGAFEAWVTKEWPGLVIDRAPLTGFYKGDDGARLDDMWCAWRARAPAPQATHAPHEKSDLYKEGYLAGKEAARGVPGWMPR